MKLLLILITLINIFPKTSSFATGRGNINSDTTYPIDKAIDDKINAKLNLLDSVIVTTMTRTGTFNIDTLFTPINTSAFYQLSIIGETGTVISCVLKQVLIRNTNGVYSIPTLVTPISFRGLTGGACDVLMANGRVVVRMTGTSASTKWTLRRQNL